MDKGIVETLIFGPLREIEFGAAGIRDIAQCLRTIATTRVGTVPLDRVFGTLWEWIDKPEPVAMARYREDLYDAIERFEPRVEIVSIQFKKDPALAANGGLNPVVRWKPREGVTL